MDSMVDLGLGKQERIQQEYEKRAINFIFPSNFRRVTSMEVSEKKKKPVVFEYSDYRLFLNNLYRYYKEETTYFSYRYFSNRAGFKSPNFLKLVIDGNRNLTEKSLYKVAKAFRFSKAEEEFFSSMVFFNQSQSIKDKGRFSRQIARFRTAHRTYYLKQAQLKYYSCWYYIPLREMIASKNFQEDTQWITEQFLGEVSQKQIAEALADLLTLGLVKRDGRGRLQVIHKNIKTEDDLVSSTVLNYHFDMIDRAAEAIVDFAPEAREISTTCVPCSENSAGKIKELIRDFRKDILALTEKDEEADKIYQLNFQFFPITGVKKRGSQ